MWDFRRDALIDLFNEAGKRSRPIDVPVPGFGVPGASRLRANGTAVAIETITLENEGLERDHGGGEPTEASFEVPPE